MESRSFDLPNDPDKKKVVAASLTAAVAALVAEDFPVEEALSAVQDMYSTILGEQTTEDVINTFTQAYR